MLWVAAVLAGVAWAEQLPASVFEMSDHLVEISPRDEVDEEDRSQRLEESRSVFVADFLELNASRMIPGLEIVMAADIELESELYMRNEVNITSTRGKVFTLDAGSSSDEKRRVFNVIRTRLCLSDVRMRGGTGDPGAAMIIQDYSTVWLQRVVISANRVLDHNAHGGGIALVGSSYLYLKDSAIGFNEAAHGAALQVTESYAYAENTVFKKNTASNSGGAISMRGDSKAHSAFMRCSYCVIKGNEANFLGFFPMPGGAISVETGADFYCEYSQIKQNTGMSDVDAKAKSTATGTLFDISDVTTSTHHSGIAEFTQVSYEPSPAPSLPRTPGPSVPPTPLPTAFPSTAMPSTATPSLVPTPDAPSCPGSDARSCPGPDELPDASPDSFSNGFADCDADEPAD
ncbi:hypothetical protein CTAYLR_001793 [Chrysophaeum taylorii]|uniref:Right handed beta helix domain-containing protein n=1 Tax=Chrysophaeum taylorii TaxID=2483200 RepID=A0AAD7UER4_9STRA|nr:hypothetical protein CTAYLR_001793 [Chrysophaeum taylorii]